MIFDDYGFVKPNGADDYMDGPHLAGILALFSHPQAVDCVKYVVNRTLDRDEVKATYVRHPNDSRFDFSRDQFILLAAGLWAQKKHEFVNLDWVTGKDIMPPSVHGMVRIIHGKKPHFWQRWNFEAELKVNWTIQKLEEPFQVIAQCMVYGDEYLKRWTEKNNLWKWAIRRYFSELDGRWRNEPELAEFVIQAIEKKINVPQLP